MKQWGEKGGDRKKGGGGGDGLGTEVLGEGRGRRVLYDWGGGGAFTELKMRDFGEREKE